MAVASPVFWQDFKRCSTAGSSHLQWASFLAALAPNVISRPALKRSYNVFAGARHHVIRQLANVTDDRSARKWGKGSGLPLTIE